MRPNKYLHCNFLHLKCSSFKSCTCVFYLSFCKVLTKLNIAHVSLKKIMKFEKHLRKPFSSKHIFFADGQSHVMTAFPCMNVYLYCNSNQAIQRNQKGTDLISKISSLFAYRYHIRIFRPVCRSRWTLNCVTCARKNNFYFNLNIYTTFAIR